MSQLDRFYREVLLNIAVDQNLSIDFLPNLRHSPHLTDDGAAFSKSFD